MNLELPVELHKQVIYSHQTAMEMIANSDILSEQQITQCFDNGSVWLQESGKPARIYDAKIVLKPGQMLHCYCNQSTLSPCPYKPELVKDFEDFSIWDKPSGMLSQGSKWGDHWTLHRWVKQNIWPERETFITHRLDRFTQGLMIVAHQKTINWQFHRLFEGREIHKTYRAIVSGLMAEGEDRTINTLVEEKLAETQIHVIGQQLDSQQSLLEIKPTTGRKHQIRIQLAELGHPVVNDRQYGLPPFEGDLMLQASGLEFNHPVTSERLCIELSNDRLLSFKII